MTIIIQIRDINIPTVKPTELSLLLLPQMSFSKPLIMSSSSSMKIKKSNSSAELFPLSQSSPIPRQFSNKDNSIQSMVSMSKQLQSILYI